MSNDTRYLNIKSFKLFHQITAIRKTRTKQKLYRIIT